MDGGGECRWTWLDVFNVPAAFLKFVPMFAQGGTTIDGVAAPRWPMAPANDDERY